jgi:MFS family permease
MELHYFTTGCVIYLYTAPNYLKTLVQFDISVIQSMIVWVLIVFTPLFGWLSDRVGRIKVIMASTIIAALYGFVALDLMVNAQSESSISFQ